MEKSTYILLNIFLLILWVLIALLSPSYLAPIQQKHIKAENVQLHYLGGKRSRISFEYEKKQYIAFCRNLVDYRGKEFCENKFPIKVNELEMDKVLNGLYRNSENIVIVKRIIWRDVRENVGEFQLGKQEYLSEFRLLKYDQYFIRLFLVMSFIAVFCVYSYKNKDKFR